MAKKASEMQPGEMHLSHYGLVRADEKVVCDQVGTTLVYKTAKVLSVDRTVTKGKPTLLHGMAEALAKAGLKTN